MRIAVFVENALTSGGAFQQTLSIVQALQSLDGHQAVVLTPIPENVGLLADRGVEAHTYTNAALPRFLDTLGGLMPRTEIVFNGLRRLGLPRPGRSLDSRLSALNIDIAVFNARTATALRLAEHPFVYTVWDLCHRDHPEFPEVFANREFERREQLLQALLPKAVAVIADSSFGASKIAAWYGVDPARITVIPFLPSAAVRRYVAGDGAATPDAVRQRFGLARPYVFYPAQSWPHKNHLYILEALAALKARHGTRVDAAFCGSDKGNTDYLLAQARVLGVADQIHMLGFVEDEDIPALYDGALALTMPSYFGPTNLPPVEAAAIGCPVIYADQPTFRAQMGDGALYCDLADPESLAGHLHDLLTMPDLGPRLTTNARAHIGTMDEDTYRQRLSAIFTAYAYKRRRWAGTGQTTP